jgi:hypothetical protein
MNLSYYLFFIVLFTGLAAWILFVWLSSDPDDEE